MINGKHTKIYDFGYGHQSTGKYNINTDEPKTLGSNQSTSTSIKSCDTTIGSKNTEVKIMAQ
jgi:hypothetical protein